MKTVFFRLIDADDKAVALLDAVRAPAHADDRRRFVVNPASFGSIPRSPFAYWVSERVRGLYTTLPALAARHTALVGLQSSDDFRFLRTWWEVEPRRIGTRWFVFAKGGAFSPFYADLVLLIGYARSDKVGLQTIGRYGRGATHYLRPGLTWPARTNGLSLRALPAGCIFGHKGPAVFGETDSADDLLALACIANSRPFGMLVSLQLARTELAQSFEVGLLQSTPVPNLAPSDRVELAVLGRRAWSLRRSLATRTETSHSFTLPALLQAAGRDVAARTATWSAFVHGIATDAKVLQADIDERCFALYGIDEADQRTITEGLASLASEETSSDGSTEVDDDDREMAADACSAADTADLLAELVSWAVGVACGRFDVRLAIGACPFPTEPEPFDALPACAPGMLTGEDGQPLNHGPAGYPLPFPETGILVDDPGHTLDLTAAVRAVFDVVFGADAEGWWNDVAELLDAKGHDPRAWLASSFFEYHIKRYSASRRKAPILWQLGTPSGRYSVWLYAHRLTPDSFFQLQNDVVGPKLAHEERQLANVRQAAGGNPSAAQRNEIAAQEAVVEELRAMLEEVKHVAPLWNPDLDDGVVLTMAPLWRLVPQHKAWQKELKGKWDELCAGRYDWAHLAMHLWPERVVPKCATDRSFAIAHGLEDEFWVEGTDGKWKPRTTPTRSVDDLVRERTSPAVKAALKSLLDAPTAPASNTKRARGRR